MRRKRLPDHDHPLAKAFLYTVILFAVIHLTISFFVGLFRGDQSLTNMFHILGFDLIWPELGIGTANALVATIVLVGVWVTMSATLIHLEKTGISEKHKK